MILKTGVDIVETRRFKELQPNIFARFLQRVFTEEEIGEANKSVEYLAGRFAAKEAVVKALGTGIGAVTWKDVEILRGGEGEPLLTLRGKAKEVAEAEGLKQWSVSISHTHEHAVAMVVASGEQKTAKRKKPNQI
jgi:holo-[acyl-carrier protein] synthase